MIGVGLKLFVPLSLVFLETKHHSTTLRSPFPLTKLKPLSKYLLLFILLLFTEGNWCQYITSAHFWTFYDPQNMTTKIQYWTWAKILIFIQNPSTPDPVFLVVWDRNSVSVTVLAESIGIGAEFFFPKPKLFFFQILLIFSYFLGEVFISLKINLALQN